jgi:hypothetical protein
MSQPQNHQDTNLRRRSFRGQNLDGGDFSGADVRGADFTDASLVDANFTDAHIGLSPLTGIVLLAVAVATAALAGVVIGWMASETRTRMFSGDWQATLGGASILLLVLVLFGFMIARGLYPALRAFAIAFVVVLTIDLVVAGLFGDLSLGLLARTIGLVVLFGLAVFTGIVARMVGGAFGPTVIVGVALIGGIAAGRASGGVGSIVVSLLLVIISKRALKADLRDRPVLVLVERIVQGGGTRFTGADLSSADFTGTKLGHSDMTDATLSGTIWDPEHPPYLMSDPPGSAEGGPTNMNS